MSFREELQALINRHSLENGSDTPDFLLADYLWGSLVAFDAAVLRREQWYGRQAGSLKSPHPRPADTPPPSDPAVVPSVFTPAPGAWRSVTPAGPDRANRCLNTLAGEEQCQDCGWTYHEVWHAPDELWQRVTGHHDGSWLRCLICFEAVAVQQGISLYWECAEGRYPSTHATPEPEPQTEAAAAIADAATWPGQSASQGTLRTQQPPTTAAERAAHFAQCDAEERRRLLRTREPRVVAPEPEEA